MNILVIGSGGREHALCWALLKSPLCQQLYCAPGNGGIEAIAQCVTLDALDHDAWQTFASPKKSALWLLAPKPPWWQAWWTI
nr:phosphoribosylamine--glycine ligase N-terminal domain-containing protein [Iodidimonas gelatinilytica]